MTHFISVTPDIQRITVPYKDIYTSVFFLKTPDGTVLFDAASTAEDADSYILPALDALKVGPQDLKYIFISHNHNDHAGGLGRLMEVFPDAVIVTRNQKLADQFAGFSVLMPQDGDAIFAHFRVVTIPGHTPDAQALLDTRTMTLVTGDCLQVYGIYGMGKWGACIRCIPEHMEALEKLRAMELTAIAMAHDYHPVGDYVRGSEAIVQCLDGCVAALNRVKTVLCANLDLDDEEIARLCNENSGLPTVPGFVPAAIRAAMAQGKF